MEGLVDHLRLQMLWQFQEPLYEVTVDDFVQGVEVDLALNAAAPEELVRADRVGGELLLLFLGHADLEGTLVSRDDDVRQVLPHLLLESCQEAVNRLSEEEAAEQATLLSC